MTGGDDVTPACGTAELEVGFVRGSSALLRSRARSPLCLLTPRPRGPSVWSYTSSLGGGMVAGDEVSLKINIDERARCFLGTQSSNKIYRSPRSRKCLHRLRASVSDDALLMLAPDPVQCFADAIYEQRQSFELAPGANLIFIDWLSAGRLARGERWSFQRFFNRTEINRAGECIFIDAIELESAAALNKFQTGRFNCLATLVMTGPLLELFARNLLEKLHALEISRGSSLLQAASPIPGGCVLRLAGSGVAEVGRALQAHLGFVPALLADDPWARKW